MDGPGIKEPPFSPEQPVAAWRLPKGWRLACKLQGRRLTGLRVAVLRTASMALETMQARASVSALQGNRTKSFEEPFMSLSFILLIVVVLILIGVLPTWGHSRSWGYGPSGGVGLVVVILLVLLLMGRI
jgi:predicted small integral membrane protein